MTFEPIWSGIIACYLFLGGLGGGAFATSAFLAWRHPEAVNMRKIGHVIAPIAVIIGLVLLFVFLTPFNEFLLQAEAQMLTEMEQAVRLLGTGG